jgi:hypothetical protein
VVEDGGREGSAAGASDGEIRTGGEAGRGEKWADGAVAWAVVETGGGKGGAAERDGVREGLGGAARGGRKVERHGSDLAAGRRRWLRPTVAWRLGGLRWKEEEWWRRKERWRRRNEGRDKVSSGGVHRSLLIHSFLFIRRDVTWHGLQN